MDNRQRRHLRVTAPLRVYDVAAKPPEALITRNVSLGGMFLLTTRRCPVGGLVELLLEHQSGKLTTRCRVTHLQADGFGVAFVHATVDLLAFVQSIIDGLLPGAGASTDRRTAPRAALDAQVVWSQTGVEHVGRLRNLSADGALVECHARPEPGSELLVYLPGYAYSLDASRPSEARGCAGKVMHGDGATFGVRFFDASAEFRMAIEHLLRSWPGGAGG